MAPRDLEQAGTVSTEVRRELLALGMSPNVVRRASVICFEGEMNIVLYSHGGRVILLVKEDRVELLFSDDGPGIADVELVSQPGYSTAPDWARELGFGAGLGINNMEQNSDLFEIRSRVGEGTVVRATILLGVPFF
ncbi:MAG TPA: anti-sigma regulatory factor [Candidatus Bipolaricaulis anaerobius]|uniref:ATP-binding protein n=1 Tax=Candidatus Bipolaricaulis anaerobius TaxID=2026885 RepID=UPI001E655B37|nr:ATP-binding protein [Candidatus Bipolaricaulis anaerobius]MDD2912075.1 anti-sigma regulatory factor [Candidatus Bipolaricaulis anaerobius]MDD3748699.1 anti-sigma regulatory factor [Candidatus Bipolaricaulis anaerobius]MDD5763795.1 anti-sigma regulatory factor [Candidatus Bipolaricaulis anaerobius]HNR25020.1 anti-sigma regulatory factor [Candidatus Bipolaricaulis anaerobius]HNS24373.1 anti-sigma regulatory factor [Candidatus Bipolaricaulis anaerobius]